MKRYVTYTRVSTRTQGAKGNGLEAQKRDMAIFLETYSEDPWEIIGEFQDVQSGKDDDRPELEKALELTRRTKGAELLVSKLDRLSRRVSFIAKIIEDKQVTLRVASMPYADTFQLHIYAALAEQEREFISKRTKAALAEVKRKGKKLGGYREGALDARNAALKANADAFAEKVGEIITPLRDAGETLQGIAEKLNGLGQGTARGKQWKAATVRQVLLRLSDTQSRDAAV